MPDWHENFENKHCRMLSAPLMIFLVDPFDSLPDSLLLLIFNKVSDVKSLGRCCAVSKRFYSLARTVDNVVVKVDCVISGDEAGHLSARGKGFFGHLLKFFGSMVRPLQALQHLLVPKRALVASTSAATTAAADVSHHSPGEVLKNFRDLEHLRIELPGGELEIEDGFLLKWKARYGSTLESCVILGASALINSGDQSSSRKNSTRTSSSWLSSAAQRRSSDTQSSSPPPPPPAAAEDDGNLPDADGGFKLRVVWTISSLIAASGRHYLLQNIIKTKDSSKGKLRQEPKVDYSVLDSLFLFIPNLFESLFDRFDMIPPYPGRKWCSWWC
ncbi:F-box protein At5g46170 [Selaginella moellendorffii]|uniref:F-box protein At5g46170 n=1 Tax=Selaginella moellendorffii TaxID=88036 RepID=UPI000D1CAB3A|nr:F-box protein At5g46170 [Selaginella moellendorffii]|eukprot:XP_024524229.1 F-box protein At5g46170 [Selaginella moellendorffii]